MNGKYRHHLRKVQGLRPYQFHKRYCMLLKGRNDNLIIKSYRKYAASFNLTTPNASV